MCFVWIWEQRLFPYTALTGWLFGAFAKLRKAALSFAISVRMEHLGSHRTDFFFLIQELEYFSNICRENSSFTQIYQEWRVLCLQMNVHLWWYLAQFFLEWEMFGIKVVEKSQYIPSPPPQPLDNRASYEIMRKNIVEAGRQQVTTWRMRLPAGYLRLHTHTQKMESLLPFHCNSGYTNTPQCYIICTLPVLL